MKSYLSIISVILLTQLEATCNQPKITYNISTGSKTGTYYQIGLNLSKYVAPDACINLNVLNSNGSLDNVLKLISKNNIKFVIVQNDVLQELQKRAKNGNEKAKKLVENIRVIAPLYNEEIHIIADANNSNINNFGDLKGKTIYVGKNKSGTAMTSFLLYSELFGEELQNAKTGDFNQALRDLGEGKVDAVIKVAGQPVSRLAKLPKESSKYIKLLSYSDDNTNHRKVTSYYKTNLKASNYVWLNKDVPTLSTKSYLVTYNYKNKREKTYIKNFVKSFRKHLKELKANASKDPNTPHPKWKEVSDECLGKLPGGWKYYKVVYEVCKDSNNYNSNSSSGNCSNRDKILGLCN